MDRAVVDILNGANWYGANARSAHQWRLEITGRPERRVLVATRTDDGRFLLVTDTTGRLEGPFQSIDDAGEIIEYFEDLILHVVSHDLLSEENFGEIDLAELERLAMTSIPPPEELPPGEWR